MKGGKILKDFIKEVNGREILNANGKPTVEAELVTASGLRVTASVPSGTSTGKYEAFELYDGDSRYGGYGTKKASAHVSGEINNRLKGMDVACQEEIDQAMCALDGTPNKSRLGANAILAASVAAARAGAMVSEKPLYQYLGGGDSLKLPDIVATVISGGVFSTSGLEFEDYMYLLSGFDDFADGLEALVKLRRELEKALRAKYGDFPEDGGALAAPLSSSREAFDIMLKVARQCDLDAHVTLGLDVAASELFQAQTGLYRVNGQSDFTREALADYYASLCREYPLKFIEDGFDQDDWEGFKLLKQLVPDIQVVGDDLFVSNVERLKIGIQKDCANALLLKINQIGTVSEAIAAGRLAQENGYDVIVSLRSGETTDDFIADLAVAVGARQIKLGSPVRAERNAKYNRLLKISQELAQ